MFDTRTTRQLTAELRSLRAHRDRLVSAGTPPTRGLDSHIERVERELARRR